MSSTPPVRSLPVGLQPFLLLVVVLALRHVHLVLEGVGAVDPAVGGDEALDVPVPGVALDRVAEELLGAEQGGEEDEQGDSSSVVKPEHFIVDGHLLPLDKVPEGLEE